MRKPLLLTAATLAMTVAGCNNYYRVTELSSKEEYFYGPGNMKMRDTPGRGYPMAFKDSRTGKSVNVETYTIEKITKAEFRKAVPRSK